MRFRRLAPSFPAARALLRDWRTASLVVFSIALVVAVNSTVMALLEAFLYPKLEVREPNRLYWVSFYGDYRYRLRAAQRDSFLMRHSRAFDLTTWHRSAPSEIVLENGERFTAVTGVRAGPHFFDVAGITPVMGRVLTPADTSGDPGTVLLSRSAATELFGTESPIDRIIKYQGAPRRVVGVLGQHADFPNTHAGVWVVGSTGSSPQRLIRIRDGFTRADVEASLDTAGMEVAARTQERFGLDVAFRLKPAVETQFRYQNFHYAIGAGCIALLLIACANAANLELGRAIGKRRQLAIRAALGASPWALVRDVFKEEALLVAVATAAALVLTYFATRVLYGVVPPSVGEFVTQPHVGWRVAAFSLGAAVLAVVLVGVLAAVRSSRADPQEALKQTAGIGVSNRRLYAGLVALELGLAIALSSGAIVMARATVAFDAQPFGYDPAPLVAGSITERRVSNAREAMATLRERVAAVPGVVSAAVTLDVQVSKRSVTIDDSTGALVELPAPGARYQVVTPGYMTTLGVTMVAGRDFDPSRTGEPQVVLDARTAERLWPGTDPVGKRIKLGALSSSLLFARIVGVVAGVPDSSRRSVLGPAAPENAHVGIFYVPVDDDPITATIYDFRRYDFIARAAGDAAQLATVIRRELLTVENAAFSSVGTMDEWLGISRARASRKFLMQLFTFFAVCGITLSGIAILSILARAVTERRAEIAMRRALGAGTRHVLHAVLRETVPVALLGTALGLLLTKYAIPLLGAQALFDDRFNAPLFALTAAAVVVVHGVFVALPAARAAAILPGEAMRSV